MFEEEITITYRFSVLHLSEKLLISYSVLKLKIITDIMLHIFTNFDHHVIWNFHYLQKGKILQQQS